MSHLPLEKVPISETIIFSLVSKIPIHKNPDHYQRAPSNLLKHLDLKKGKFSTCKIRVGLDQGLGPQLGRGPKSFQLSPDCSNDRSGNLSGVSPTYSAVNEYIPFLSLPSHCSNFFPTISLSHSTLSNSPLLSSPILRQKDKRYPFSIPFLLYPLSHPLPSLLRPSLFFALLTPPSFLYRPPPVSPFPITSHSYLHPSCSPPPLPPSPHNTTPHELNIIDRHNAFVLT